MTTPKRILRSIRLDKIAAVDKPCQEHAVVAIVKRAPDAPATIIKATFQQALTGCLLADQVREAFYTAFDNMYEGKDAFRTALVDELAAGGDGTTASDAYKAWLTGLVDKARVAAVAAGAGQMTSADLNKAFTDAADQWLLSQQEDDTMTTITTRAALLSAVSKFDPQKTTYGEVVAIKKAATDLNATDALPAEGPLAIEAAKPDPAVADLQREIAVLKMDTATRQHFDGLDATAQTAFLAKSATEQKADLDAIAKGDPIVHTCTDGTVIRKSDGATLLALAKRNDTLAKDNETLRAETTGVSIAKRAATEFPNVAEKIAVNMLKSAQSLGVDTEEGKAVMASLGQMNKGRSSTFETFGTTDAGEVSGDIKKAQQDFSGKVAEIKKRDSCNTADAMTKARAEAPELFAAAHPDREDDAE